mmetsp:Transcript_68915/g.223374  ORF Transcript_68915/g.223374 Transcript_68915/m.223374 type:complete len:247 (+) Transcript_68915:268-1008(+)
MTPSWPLSNVSCCPCPATGAQPKSMTQSPRAMSKGPSAPNDSAAPTSASTLATAARPASSAQDLSAEPRSPDLTAARCSSARRIARQTDRGSSAPLLAFAKANSGRIDAFNRSYSARLAHKRRRLSTRPFMSESTSRDCRKVGRTRRTRRYSLSSSDCTTGLSAGAFAAAPSPDSPTDSACPPSPPQGPDGGPLPSPSPALLAAAPCVAVAAARFEASLLAPSPAVAPAWVCARSSSSKASKSKQP